MALGLQHPWRLQGVEVKTIDGEKELHITIDFEKGTKFCDDDETVHAFECYQDVPLNDANYDYRVNVMIYTEKKASGKVQRFSWVTKLALHEKNVYHVMRAGRSRWRIENETFNTLKNQGYHFEHNYGHGYENLCSVMTMLMLLAFLIDQVQQLCCKVYQKARKQAGTFSELFIMRALS